MLIKLCYTYPVRILHPRKNNLVREDIADHLVLTLPENEKLIKVATVNHAKTGSRDFFYDPESDRFFTQTARSPHDLLLDNGIITGSAGNSRTPEMIAPEQQRRFWRTPLFRKLKNVVTDNTLRDETIAEVKKHLNCLKIHHGRLLESVTQPVLRMQNHRGVKLHVLRELGIMQRGRQDKEIVKHEDYGLHQVNQLDQFLTQRGWPPASQEWQITLHNPTPLYRNREETGLNLS